MRILLSATLILFATTAFAGLYKWVDEDGNVHYTQKRPLDKDYERLKAPAPAPENSTPLYQSTTPSKQENNTVEAETSKNKALKAENCAKAKQSLQNHQIFQRFRDKDGNVTRIDDQTRAKNIEEAKQAINDFCN